MSTRRFTSAAARLCGTAAIATIMVGAQPAAAQDQARNQGQVLYRVHCAACHGIDARGHGPMTPALRQEPPDLTRLSAANGGLFPVARVRRIVDGREVEAHGTRDMPVWGDVFKTTRDNMTPGDAAARILAIVRYLESIQQRDAQ